MLENEKDLIIKSQGPIYKSLLRLTLYFYYDFITITTSRKSNNKQ